MHCLSSTAHYQQQRPNQPDEKIETIVPQCSAVADLACVCDPEAVVLFASTGDKSPLAERLSHKGKNPTMRG